MSSVKRTESGLGKAFKTSYIPDTFALDGPPSALRQWRLLRIHEDFMTKIRYDQIAWEDEEVTTVTAPEPEEDFAALLASEKTGKRRRYQPGEQITARVVHVSTDSADVLLDLGYHITGILDRSSAPDNPDEPSYKIGDEVKAYVIQATETEVRLSMTFSSSANSVQDLLNACRNKVPVRGKVEKENKGGFEVVILGRRAFCPMSQMDSRFVEDKALYIGKEFDFLIEKVEEGGRNLVVSRAALLRLEAESRVEELLRQIEAGESPDLDGTVTDVRDYGAFVDLGGLDGFVHISELSHLRVKRAQDFVNRGDAVRVKVLKVEYVDGKRRIALSIKAAANDPWSLVNEQLSVGDRLQAKVSRLEDFGAFVVLPMGVEGLIHISEFSWDKHIKHPSELVQVNDLVNVRVVELNPSSRRIGLSLRNAEDDPWLNVETRLPRGSTQRGKVEALKGFGAIVNLGNGLNGLLPLATMKKVWGEAYRPHTSPGKSLEVTVAEIDSAQQRILLSLPQVQSDEADASDYRQYLDSFKQGSRAPSPKTLGSFGAILAAKLNKK